MKIKLIDFGLEKDHYPFRPHENDVVLCQEKVQIKCNQFSLF